MLPYITIGNRSVPMYAVMILAGVIAALLYYRHSIRRSDFPEADADLALIYNVIGVFLGAKLLWLATVWSGFLSELPYLFTSTQLFLQKYLAGGFVFYGGLFGGLLAAWLYCRINKLPFFELARVLMPVVPLFHAFGRLGCFFVGCCYGCVSEHFGLIFTHSEIAPNGVPLLPVQLVEAAGEFALFFLLARLSRKEESGRTLFSTWMICYAVLRFVLEFFRGDDYRGFLGVLSVSQFFSLIAVGLAAVALVTNRAAPNCPETPSETKNQNL